MDVVIKSNGGRLLIPTDLQFEIPVNCYGRIASRSSIALKNGIDVMAGVVDSDYRGNVKILLINHSQDDFHVNIGDRIAQIIFEKICYPCELLPSDDLTNTQRMDAGFGSSGK